MGAQDNYCRAGGKYVGLCMGCEGSAQGQHKGHLHAGCRRGRWGSWVPAEEVWQCCACRVQVAPTSDPAPSTLGLLPGHTGLPSSQRQTVGAGAPVAPLCSHSALTHGPAGCCLPRRPTRGVWPRSAALRRCLAHGPLARAPRGTKHGLAAPRAACPAWRCRHLQPSRRPSQLPWQAWTEESSACR